VLYRPAGLSLLHHPRNTRDISLGGMRVFSDDDFRVGSRLDLDIQLADGSAVRCWGEVVWIVPMTDGDPAGFDVGLRFTDMAPQDIQRLATVLSAAR
jgi:Tfp pilus assembly protein PilZ